MSGSEVRGRLRIKEIDTFNEGLQEPEWYDYALCRSYPKEWWFPYSDTTYLYQQAAKALKICNGDPEESLPECPVKDLCFEHALNFATHGIWGGQTANQVKQERRARGQKVNRY